MANLFQDGLWILDTADTAELLNGITYPLYINRIEWQPGANGEGLVIKDQAGKVRLNKTSIAASPAGDEFWNYGSKPLEVDGFVLHTMGGGTLYVYFA